MTKPTLRMTRRTALKGAAAAGAVLAAPGLVRAEAGAPKLATLTPLTGAGGSYGPSMRKSAVAGKAEGTAMRDAMRSVSQGEGEAVDNAADGIRLLSEGQPINYAGESGPCDFDEIGDISSATFRFDKINNGQFELMKMV